jgi:hypothetical protein
VERAWLVETSPHQRAPLNYRAGAIHPSIAFLRLTAMLLWGLSSEQGVSSFVFLSLKVVFVFSVLLRFLFFGSLFLALLQSAIRTRTVSVPYDDSKSAKRSEAHPIYKTGSAS